MNWNTLLEKLKPFLSDASTALLVIAPLVAVLMVGVNKVLEMVSDGQQDQMYSQKTKKNIRMSSCNFSSFTYC